MRTTGKKKLLYIILTILAIMLAGAGTFLWWFSYHYKETIKKQLPAAVENATDGIYHITYKDINIGAFDHTLTITGVQLWPDKERVKALRKAHRRTPPTLSTLSIPLLEAKGISWSNITTTHSIDCEQIVVHSMKWLLECTPHPEDSSLPRKKKDDPFLQRISAAHVEILKPDVTYHFTGRRGSFKVYMKGGTASLENWAYNTDQKKDTSVFLYAQSGKVRFDELIFSKPASSYTTKKPEIDFESGPDHVTLKNVKIKDMVNRSKTTGSSKEIYNLSFPRIKLTGLNWNELITNTLHATRVDATAPQIYVRYYDEAETKGNKMGSYPHQLLLQVGLETNLEKVNIEKAHLKYTEVIKEDEEAIIDFTNIHGSLTNVTNMREVINKHPKCVIKLDGKFMGKSDISATFNFNLTDTTGKFTMDGVVKNMDGDDVVKQAQAFTFVAVTSFHLNKMDIHIEGDEQYAKGDFTVLYQDLKISLLKFKSKHRKGKRGPLSFLGSTLILYPSNPIKDKDPRTVSTSFARDPEKGFINVIWKNIFRAAKKTAVRNEGIIELTDGKETARGEDPKKKSFLKRLFGKRK